MKLIAVFCAEDSALQFSWPVGRQAAGYQAGTARLCWQRLSKAVVVSDASAALVSIVLQTLTSLVSGGSRARLCTSSHRHRPPAAERPHIMRRADAAAAAVAAVGTSIDREK